MEQETKKRVWQILFFIVAVVTLFAGGFLFVRKEGQGIKKGTDNAGAGKTESASPGYALDAPSSWRIEKDGDESIAVYPDAGCKIEFSALPPLGGMDQAAWITKELSEDPTLEVAENASEGATVSGMPAIRWDGTIDGASTTLIYIFAPAHVYEVAPSSLSGTPITSHCAPYLDTFLQQITITG